MDGYTGKCIGGAMGHFLRIGKDRNEGCMGSYLRIRVGINVSKPLIKAVAFKPVGWMESKLVKVKYERLPHLSFLWPSFPHWEFMSSLSGRGREISKPMYDVYLHVERMEAWLTQQQQDQEASV